MTGSVSTAWEFDVSVGHEDGQEHRDGVVGGSAPAVRDGLLGLPLAYWTNTPTTYVVTNRRVLEEYRFLSLVRDEVPIEKVRSVDERRSPVESLVGLGDVTVRSGAGSMVTVRSVADSTSFADVVRRQL